MKHQFNAMAVVLVLVALPFTATAQEPDPCVHEWECFDWYDHQKEKVLISLSGHLCPEDEYGVGFVALRGRSLRLDQVGRFVIRGLNLIWWFGDQMEDSESGLSTFDYAVQIYPDGTGHYYDFSNVEVGESVNPSETFKCVELSDQ